MKLICYEHCKAQIGAWPSGGAVISPVVGVFGSQLVGGRSEEREGNERKRKDEFAVVEEGEDWKGLLGMSLKGVENGKLGNVFAFVLFVSPIPTFRRIIRNQTTEQFSGLPYIYALLNCLICLWYGMPFIILIATVNSFGAVFQLIYIIIFIVYANRSYRLKMSALLLTVFAFFCLLAFSSIRFFDPDLRKLVVGYQSVASLISMFASPLVVI